MPFLSLSYYLYLWFTHERRNQTLRKSSSFIFLLSLFLCVPQDNEHTRTNSFIREVEKKGSKERERERASQFGTRAIGGTTTATFQLNSFVPDAKEKAENTAKTRVLSLGGIYICLRAPPTETVYVAMALTRLKVMLFSSLFHPNVSQYAQDLSEITLSIEEC